MGQSAENGLPTDAVAEVIRWSLNQRAQHGRHLHHRACIHNLPPEEQVEVRGKTVEWWTACVGDLPTQITPDQWECDPPPTSVIPPVEGGAW